MLMPFAWLGLAIVLEVLANLLLKYSEGFSRKGLGVASDGLPSGFAAPFAWGIVASGVVGWVAVWGTLRIVRSSSFRPFVAYRVIAGVGFLLLYALR